MKSAKVSALIANARNLVSSRTTEEICGMFESLIGKTSIAETNVRGWIMDELEKRDPNAFLLWIESEDVALMDYPSKFFLAESATQNK